MTVISHLVWLIASALAAAWLLARGSGAGGWLRKAAGATLALVAADAVLWALGHLWLHPVAALAAGGLLVACAAASTGSASPRGPEQSLVRALEQWPEAAALADAQGVVAWANPAWTRRHGLEPGAAAGKQWRDFHPAGEVEDRLRPLLDGARSRGTAAGMVDRLDGRGETWSSHTFMALVRAEEGGAEREVEAEWMVALSLGVDEASLRHRAREIGHNLNNLLSAVVGNVGLAIETPGVDAQLRKDLGEAEDGALRAAELIHQLQAIARGEE